MTYATQLITRTDFARFSAIWHCYRHIHSSHKVVALMT